MKKNASKQPQPHSIPQGKASKDQIVLGLLAAEINTAMQLQILDRDNAFRV
jgi:hypothetical protein